MVCNREISLDLTEEEDMLLEEDQEENVEKLRSRMSLLSPASLADLLGLPLPSKPEKVLTTSAFRIKGFKNLIVPARSKAKR